MVSLYVQSEKTKQKQTHRHRERADGYQRGGDGAKRKSGNGGAAPLLSQKQNQGEGQTVFPLEFGVFFQLYWWWQLRFFVTVGLKPSCPRCQQRPRSPSKAAVADRCSSELWWFARSERLAPAGLKATGTSCAMRPSGAYNLFHFPFCHQMEKMASKARGTSGLHCEALSSDNKLHLEDERPDCLTP